MAGHLAAFNVDEGGNEMVGGAGRVTISKHAETYGNGQWYTLELFEDASTGVRGIAESYGEIKHFPRAMRTKRNFDAAIEDEERERAVQEDNDREEALEINGREATFQRNSNPTTGRRSTTGKRSSTAAKRKKSSSSTTSRRTQRSSTTATGGDLRRSTRASRTTGRDEEQHDDEAADDTEERRQTRERTPRPAANTDRVTRSSSARVGGPIVKSETEDIEHLLDNFDIASVAESDSTMVYSRAGSVISNVGGVASTSRMV